MQNNLSFINNMFLKITFLLLLSLLFFKVEAAENYIKGDVLFVGSPKGLNLRSAPYIDAKIIKNISYNSNVKIMDDNILQHPFSLIVDDFWDKKGIKLSGYWVKISVGELEGYVFDGILTKYKYNKYGVGINYEYIFGLPKIDTVEKAFKYFNKKKYISHYKVTKTYSNLLIEKEEFLDDCWNIEQTFKNISFNEAYWLINRSMINADAINEVKILRTKESLILKYYSCT